MRVITSSVLHNKINAKEDFMLFHLLPGKRGSHSHLPGSYDITPEFLKQKATQLVPDKNKDIVVYGEDHSATEQAIKDLENRGYRRVFDFEESIE